jgi:hypothetical protein
MLLAGVVLGADPEATARGDIPAFQHSSIPAFVIMSITSDPPH